MREEQSCFTCHEAWSLEHACSKIQREDLMQPSDGGNAASTSFLTGHNEGTKGKCYQSAEVVNVEEELIITGEGYSEIFVGDL